MPSAEGRGSKSKIFGWLNDALMRKLRHRGVCKVDWIFTFACAAYDLVRMRNLGASSSCSVSLSRPKCVSQRRR